MFAGVRNLGEGVAPGVPDLQNGVVSGDNVGHCKEEEEMENQSAGSNRYELPKSCKVR